MDPLGQIYLVCAIVGWGFIIATFALGQFGHGHGVHADAAHLGHDGGGGHVGSHHIGGGHTAGHDVGHGAHASADDAHSTSANPVVKSRDNQLYFTLLGIFSPVTMSVFTGFFGTVGFLSWHYLPFLAYFSLIPAIASGIIATQIIKRLTAALVTKLASSSLTSRNEAVGRIAEVNTPIKDGRMGEVSYVIGNQRFNASARPVKEGEEFHRGSKVMIVETEGSVVFVEAAHEMDVRLLS